MKRLRCFTHTGMVLALGAAMVIASSAQAVTVDWVGGTGSWYLGSVWDDGGGATDALTLFDTSQGWFGGGAAIVDPDVVIGAGDDVFFDGGIVGDFRYDQNGPANGGSVTVSGGGKFTINSSVDFDGEWSQFDADSVTVTGAGSVLKKTFNSTDSRANPGISGSGGAFIFGSFLSGADPESIAINVTDGGLFDMDGQLHFGWWDRVDAGDSDVLDVTMTISDQSHVKLTGGDNVDLLGGASGGLGQNDLVLHRDWNDNGAGPADETYIINFSGHGGSLSMDHSAMTMPIQTGPTAAEFDFGTLADLLTYEDLWSGKDRGAAGASIEDVPAGILQASGSSAGAFGDSFAVVGTSGSDGYKLTSIQGAAQGGSNVGDINGDLLVDGADAGIMFTFWSTGLTPGTRVAEGDIASIGGPDPPSDDLIDGLDAGIMFANFSADPGPAAPGTATAQYNSATGEVIVSVDGVNNWYVESASGSLSGPVDGSATLPFADAGNVISDSDIRIGETSLGLFSYTDVNLGQVALAGLRATDFSIWYNAGVGQPLMRADVVPEPATVALVALGLVGALASRRRMVA